MTDNTPEEILAQTIREIFARQTGKYLTPHKCLEGVKAALSRAGLEIGPGWNDRT